MSEEEMVECPECEGKKRVEDYCGQCSGSGEGNWDGSTCRYCKGLGIEYLDCEKCKGTGEVSEFEE